LKRGFRSLAAFCCLALALCVSAGAASENSLLHKSAPAIVGRDLAGRTVSLRAYRGKVVLLNFWATWCAPCQVELPRFAAWQRKYGPEGLQVIGIAMDDAPGPVRARVRRLGLGFPVMMGDAAIGTRYGGVLGLPVTFLIARDGTAAARFAGETSLEEMEKEIQGLLAGD
jgi:cytochrome c biogenesis protein CcmG/thiol:disulfide interchange protein DsbE